MRDMRITIDRALHLIAPVGNLQELTEWLGVLPPYCMEQAPDWIILLQEILEDEYDEDA